MTLFDEVERRKSYYETLGIAETAENAEIKKAYFGMVRKYQPDRFPEEFKEIRAAYETLTDPKKRAEYDMVGSLPPYAASMLHEAQWFERAGKHSKAAECYQRILKRHPELDSVREQYARFLSADDKTGKAMEVWEELCRRHPDNAGYLRELGRNFFERGWTRKAFDTAQRALNLDRSSIASWILVINCTADQTKYEQNFFDHLYALSLEALEAVRPVKKEEWKKIPLHVHALIGAGAKNINAGRDQLQEIIRLIREGGRQGQDEGSVALEEILNIIPIAAGLGRLYPEVKELAELLPNTGDAALLSKLNEVKISFEIQGLEQKGFHVVFHDLLNLLQFGFDEDEDKLEIIAMEHEIIENRDRYYSQLRRLKTEFPELYALHGAFFREAMSARDPEKLLYRREKQYDRLKREIGLVNDDPEYQTEQPVRRVEPKVGRNDPCPCGSGKKYKRCCGA